MKNIRRAPRWKVLLHAIRIFNEHLYKDMIIHLDDKELILENADEECDLDVVDARTGEIIVTYGEDGTPEYLSDWANDDMDYVVYNSYPMYDYD